MDAQVKDVLSHYVGGRRVDGVSGRFGDIYNPATGEVTRKVPLASADEVRVALADAASAFPAWAETPPGRRVQVLYRYRELLHEHLGELAELLSSEHGKTLDDARGSITRGLEVVEFACGIPQLLKGEYTEGVAAGVDSWSMRQPLGVVAGITPFNFPAMVPMWMFPVAIACGNTFVLKPSERDPSCSLYMAALMSEAGLPDGVLNVVNGDKEAVDVLLTDPTVQAVSFVGSTAVGEYIYQTGCAHGKRVQALCGAKNHMVVMPDADMGQVVDAVMGAAYGSAGERCMAISVVVTVGENTAERMLEQLVPRIEALKVGAYDQDGVEMGPVITPDARDRIKGCIDRGVAEGAELVVDGRGISIAGYEGGCFVGATVFDKVTPEMKIYQEEIFGPVLSVVRAGSYEEAVALVNDHEYGNGTAIFTRDGDAARDFGHRARIGMVGVNVPIPVPLAFHSFGGWKRSLFGDHYMHGPEGVRFYTRMKTLTSRWPSGIKEGAVYNFKAGGEH
ncbi:MAG: CoA-acylating methylmalonate-semialdehyde dehydrogenase [Arenicellales bacterium]|jgi:malonate-semialdehyde dehydrogenase (acetylating)/methylmalonate-semialdehyde dehydrogenase|nr:CoA-acylating methylmalonate-semialdehyde dehydrogenase [Arenicellales bacterium]MDP6314464.1 CoA-acylating methylmalonate-semialdehyde dehydrogenase [Arenicellales bacterium]MDP7118954.1 CoA-acylating methylmalonate-semialdehyde dehydrogenase [Arenicellales bacterium]MDP7563622.1 CoA-acylating methylmalonate-semialdehyde dehydrogenase [Arenicellales bacterium]MEE1566260.1 CoA-acylating methylmalonate-semialdehyde dehydrogenase [Arenicellales bacterium]|tara:strand:- start:146 stop:1663 length:1518 start_codon:yes stop_codon:yes gene_type:complete